MFQTPLGPTLGLNRLGELSDPEPEPSDWGHWLSNYIHLEVDP